MRLHLRLRQPHHLPRLEREAVEAEPAGVDPVIAPALVALGQVEELPRGRAVAVEIDLERRLLGAGEGAGDVARAVQEIVDASGERGIARDRGRDLGSDFADVSHATTIRGVACIAQVTST
jgi:hypothetical protein